MKRGRPITIEELNEVHAKRTVPEYVYDVINGFLENDSPSRIRYSVDAKEIEKQIRDVMPENVVFRKWWLSAVVEDYKKAGLEVFFL